jgi:hypothetical protein
MPPSVIKEPKFQLKVWLQYARTPESAMRCRRSEPGCGGTDTECHRNSGAVNVSRKKSETASDEAIVSAQGHSYWVRCVTWSPDGDLLATASADNHVRIFQCDGTEAFKCVCLTCLRFPVAHTDDTDEFRPNRPDTYRYRPFVLALVQASHAF